MKSEANDTGPQKARRQGGSPGYPKVISVLELYGIEEAKRRLGWTTSAFRAAKRRGLRVLVCGKRRYVTGREVLRFLEAQQEGDSQPD
jgi:hypothetical protein